MKFTLNMLLTCISYCDAGPGCDIRTVGKHNDRLLSRIPYLSSYVLRRRRSLNYFEKAIRLPNEMQCKLFRDW